MIYTLSDIHGNIDAWNSIKSVIKLTKDDTLIVLGDVIDRNPGGISILEEIMDSSNIVMLLGNHECMMHRALTIPDWDGLDHWFQNGGETTLREFYELPKERRDQIMDYITCLPLVMNVNVDGTVFELCHAAPPETYDPEFSKFGSHDHVLWNRTSYQCPKNLNHPVIFGHTPVCKIVGMECFTDNRMEIVELANRWYAIDCGAAYPSLGGRLGCLCLNTMKDYYSE